MRRERESPGEQNRATRQQILGEAWWTSEFLGLMKPGGHNQHQVAKGIKLAERGQVVIKALHIGSTDSIVFEPIGGIRKVTLWVVDLEDEWEIVYRILAENQVLFTRLLNGDYAEELDDVLRGAGITIIPSTVMDLDYRCDCISDTHICGHIIATYLALGTYINDNPMILFELRGRSREDIIAGVDAYSSEKLDPDASEEKCELLQDICQDTDEYDPPDPARYYDAGSHLEKIRFMSKITAGKESELIRLLGPSSIRLGKRDLAEIIGECYPKAAWYAERFRIIGTDNNQNRISDSRMTNNENEQADEDVPNQADNPGSEN